MVRIVISLITNFFASPRRIPSLRKTIIYLFCFLGFIGLYEYSVGSNMSSMDIVDGEHVVVSEGDITDMDLMKKGQKEDIHKEDSVLPKPEGNVKELKKGAGKVTGSRKASRKEKVGTENVVDKASVKEGA
jgi:hypothetical protein